MNTHVTDLDALLDAADPSRDPLSEATLRAADDLVTATRHAPAPRRRRTRRVWIPALTIGVLAFGAGTGAAVAGGLFDSWHVHFTIGGETVDKDVTADAVIPLTWTTRAGDHMSCTWAISYSWGETADIAAFVAAHDWTGIGQRAYDYHLAHPYYPERVEFIDQDGTRTLLTPEEIRAAGPEFSHAVDTVIGDELPADLRDDEYFSTGQTDCNYAEPTE